MTSFPQEIFEMMVKSQYWPPADLQAFQRSQLSQLLKHAYAKSTFYRNRLNMLFDHNGEVDWRRWPDVPITRRADLRDYGKDMLVTELPPSHGPVKEFHTSGSSGVPISIAYGPIFSATAQATKYRAFAWHGIDYTKSRARLSLNVASGERLVEDFFVDTWGPFWTSKASHGRDVVINRALSSERQLRMIAEQQVRYLSAFPNSVELLARINTGQSQRVQLDCIMAYGQSVSAEQLSLFESSFGAKCMQLYSSKEGGKIAYQCPGHSHFHINSETVLLEILDEHDRPCPPGVPGRVIVTPIFNSAQPLIRYEQGDVGVLGEVCPCGRTLPVLQDILGRQDPIWSFPDGLRIAPRLKHTMLREAMQALAYQIAQVGPMILEVRYIPVTSDAKPDETAVRLHIMEMIRPDITVLFRPLDTLPTNSGGKMQLFTTDVD